MEQATFRYKRARTKHYNHSINDWVTVWGLERDYEQEEKEKNDKKEEKERREKEEKDRKEKEENDKKRKQQEWEDNWPWYI